jgi:hypothetical protein
VGCGADNSSWAAALLLQVALLQNTSSLDVALARNASTYNTGELDISQLWNVRTPRLLLGCIISDSSEAPGCI